MHIYCILVNQFKVHTEIMFNYESPQEQKNSCPRQVQRIPPHHLPTTSFCERAKQCFDPRPQTLLNVFFWLNSMTKHDQKTDYKYCIARTLSSFKEPRYSTDGVKSCRVYSYRTDSQHSPLPTIGLRSSGGQRSAVCWVTKSVGKNTFVLFHCWQYF